MNTEIRTTTASARARRRRMGAGLTVLPLAGLLALAGPAGASSSHPNGPPGNNGTIKIDGKAFDSHNDNEPHVGCDFEVDFYGFDMGVKDATVTFTVQPPTGKGNVLLTGTVPIGEDDNSGGGSEAGLDATKEYDLGSALVGHYTPQAQQGYHVKLTVNAPGSQGADTKHKVFWVQGCTLPAVPPVVPIVPPADVTPIVPAIVPPVVNAATTPAPATVVLGETLTKPAIVAPAAAAPATTVLGEQLSAAPVGGVQTGGGGTSDSGNPLVPFAGALAFLALAGYVAPRLRRIG